MPAKQAAKQQEQKISLTIVVQGTGIVVEANANQPLKGLIGKSLEKAGVAGGDLTNWYFSDEAGKELNADKTIEDLGLTTGQTVLLNQRAGAAG